MTLTAPAPASMVSSGELDLAKLSEREVFELGQYEKIIQLRDAIVSRKHPTTTSPLGSNAPLDPIPSGGQNATDSEMRPAVCGERGSVSAVPIRPKGAAEPETNSIHPEKSDLNAELRAQRQRLERALRDDVEQLRAEKAGCAQPSAELDSADVLAKALVIVQATAASAVNGEKLNVNANAEPTSDSFDESTFYSSRHDTPESHLVSLIRNPSQDVQAANIRPQHDETWQQVGGTSQKLRPDSGTVAGAAAAAASASAGPAGPARVLQPPSSTERGNSSTTNANLTSQMSIVPGLNNYVQTTSTSKDLVQTVSGVAGWHDAPRQDGSRTSVSQAPTSNIQALRDSGLETHPPSPLVRNHNTLQPVAPQPTHPSSISALAAASPVAHDAARAAGRSSAVGTPTQVDPLQLQTEQNSATSPDSSSQGGRKRGRKKKKKKKRKADTQGGVSAESVSVIKQEPRSPSPLHALSYIRPSKRARHVQDRSAAHEYEASSYNPGGAHDTGAQYVSRPVRDHAMPAGQPVTAASQAPYSSATAARESRYGGGGRYYDDQVAVVEGPRHHEGRVIDHPPHYLARTAPAPGPVPQFVLAESHAMSSRPYREYPDGLRMSAHPEAEMFMAPPRPAPARIMVDAYGREYIEPSHRVPSRLSMASPSRHGDHEVLYERLPPRIASRQAMAGSYEDGGGLIYQAPAEAYALPRRVVTQPGYTSHEHRDMHQRELSYRPTPVQAEFVHILPPSERRYGEDGYGTRPASVRPVDGARYPMPPEYGQVHGVRPELPVATEYRASVHPDSRRETLQPYMRGYHSAPTQEPIVQRAYSARPPEPALGGQLRGGRDEIAFIERPRDATQEIVYVDDARREVFR